MLNMFLNIFFQHIFAKIHTFLRYIDKLQAEESAVKQVKNWYNQSCRQTCY